MDEDPLQIWTYCLTFVESLYIIFSQYTETCEVILHYSKIREDDNEDNAEKSIRKILHANIDVHNRRLIADCPKYGIN